MRLFTPALLHLGVCRTCCSTATRPFCSVQFSEFHRSAGGDTLMILLIAGMSNISQCCFVGPNFGGYSGVVYGLFGYLWLHTQFNPHHLRALSQRTIVMFGIWTVLCLTGAVGHVAKPRICRDLRLESPWPAGRVSIGRHLIDSRAQARRSCRSSPWTLVRRRMPLW
ncbi:MAG: rhomboid family intramembrane serine protease [Planctomycetaceae bacterium]